MQDSCHIGVVQFMIHPRHVQRPTDAAMPVAFDQGEAAGMAGCHAMATQVAARSQPLAKQGAVRQAWPARLAQSRHHSRTPPSRAGDGPGQRTASRRQGGDKPHGGQPGHEGQTLRAGEHPARTVTHAVSLWAPGHASWQRSEVVG